MLAETSEASQTALDAFRDATGRPDLSAEQRALEATALDDAFPGALLVWDRGADRVPVFYAIAHNHRQWRQLRPLLLAFAGPTLTDFSGAPRVLSPTLAHEALLAGSNPAAVARLVPHPGTAPSALRALNRLRATVARAPTRGEAAPVTTGRLLARVRDHLNNLAIEAALEILDQCRREHRLDALNLRFLEIEILGAARDWTKIASAPYFDALLLTRRPPAVTAALLEALYRTASPESELTLDAYHGDVRFRAQDLIRLPPPATLDQGGWRLYGLEALSDSPRSTALARAALGSGHDLGVLQTAVAALIEDTPAEPAAQDLAAPVEAAAAIEIADINGGLSAFEQAATLVDQLTPDERAVLFRNDAVRLAFEDIEAQYGDTTPPSGWSEWLGRLDDPEFTTAAAIARQGAREWRPGFDDPSFATRLADGIENLPLDGLAFDRFVDGLPHLIAWLVLDPEFARPAAYAIYERALERLVLAGRITPLMDSAAVLFRALLSLGPSAEAYRRLLTDSLSLIGEGAGVRAVSWLLEIVDETIVADAPDQAAREEFWHQAIGRLVPVASQLTALQRTGLGHLGSALGWAESTSLETFESSATAGADEELAARLSGKLIAIYTLTESAAAQAVQRLHLHAPGADVRVSSEHVGTKALKSLAENADLFVVVAASATHAATDFIRANRGDRALIFAAGRGALSILRAIDEWSATQPATSA